MRTIRVRDRVWTELEVLAWYWLTKLVKKAA